MNNKIAAAKLESAHMIYTEKGELIAIVKRDDISGKHITYSVNEMSSADIAELMAGSLNIAEHAVRDYAEDAADTFHDDPACSSFKGLDCDCNDGAPAFPPKPKKRSA